MVARQGAETRWGPYRSAEGDHRSKAKASPGRRSPAWRLAAHSALRLARLSRRLRSVLGCQPEHAGAPDEVWRFSASPTRSASIDSLASRLPHPDLVVADVWRLDQIAVASYALSSIAMVPIVVALQQGAKLREVVPFDR